MKLLYKLVGILIWMAGVILLALAMHVSHWHLDFLKLVTIAAMAMAAVVVIFSFLYGAQPGHYIRIVMIVLFTIICSLIYLNQSGAFFGSWYRFAILSVAATMVIISRVFRKKFIAEYKHRGKVNYFDIYFDG